MGDKHPSDTALALLTFQGPLKISHRPLNHPKTTCSVVFIPFLVALISPKVPLYTKRIKGLALTRSEERLALVIASTSGT